MAKKVTLAAIAALLMLTTSAWAQTEVRFTHSITGGSSREALDAIIAGFEAANPDIKIKQIVFDDDQYSNQGLITQLKSNEVPDIFFEWAGYPVQRDVAAGYAYDLTDAMAADGWKDTFSAAVWTVSGAAVARSDQHHLVQQENLRRAQPNAAQDLGRVRRADQDAGRCRRDSDRRGQ
jgi:raffinose/stachyose/melibiose transport system substrate-binding protein